MFLSVLKLQCHQSHLEVNQTYWITVPVVKTRSFTDAEALFDFLEQHQIKYLINSEQFPLYTLFNYNIAPCHDSVL